MPDTDADKILQRLARIETLLETEGARCPYREQLVRASNNVEERHQLALRVTALEDHVTDVRINVARMLATGGAGGIVGALVMEFIKQLPQIIK